MIKTRYSYFSQIVAITCFCLLPILSNPSYAEPFTNCLNDSGNPGASDNCSATQGAASQETSTSSAAAANPINVMNGNKYQQEQDMAPLPGELGLELVRHYNSSMHAYGYTGYGWRLSYETELFAIGSTIQIVQADGARIIYTRDHKYSTKCTPNDPARGTVIIHKTPRGDEYTWVWANGRTLYFNTKGKLERITSATGNTVNLLRGPKGALLKVTDPQGRSMTFEYAPKHSKGFRGIMAVNTPLGRYEYQHNHDRKSAGFGNLLSVTYPNETLNADSQSETEPTKNKITKTQETSHIVRAYHYAENIEIDANKGNVPTQQQAAHWLTGITVKWQDKTGKAKQKRTNAWVYNAQGRGVLSVLGAYDPTGNKPGPGQTTIAYDNPDQYTAKDTAYVQSNLGQGNQGMNTTTLTNSLGQKTVFKHTVIAGQYRMVEVLGAGCSTCPPTNMRYRYDDLAREVERIQLTPTGQAIASTRKYYDKASRITRIEQVRYQNGQAKTAQLIKRFEYPLLPQAAASATNASKNRDAAKLNKYIYAVYNKPILIAAPSVVAGKEHQWHIEYNDYGQPLKVTETGFAPSLSKGEGWGEGNQMPATQISRTITYTYSKINNRSLLTKVDGPLPNGKTNTPTDSDIATYAYDKRGSYLVKTTMPGNITTQYAYDVEGNNAATGGMGRIIVTKLNDGARQIKTKTQYSQQAASINQPTSITRTAWLLDADGKLDEASHQRITILKAEYDVVGKRISHTGSDGNRSSMVYNDEGQASTLTNSQGDQLHWAYDKQNRLLAQVSTDASGEVVDGRMWLRNEPGKVRAMLNPNGIEQVRINIPNLSRDLQEKTRFSSLEKNAQPVITDVNTLARIKLRDDFGRTIYEYHPEDGAIITNFDTVNDARLGSGEQQTQMHIGLTGKTKQIEKLHFNFAGQLLARERYADGEAPCTDTLAYEGKLLKSLTGCGSEQTFVRNAFGQITTQTQTVYPAKHKVSGSMFTQQFSYDNAGKLISRTLPTQQVLNYGDGVQQNGQTQSIQLQRSWLTRLAKLTSQGVANSVANTLPVSWTHNTLISQVQQQPFNATMTALQSVKHGNGITTTWQTSKQSHTKNAVPLMVKVSAALNAQYGIATQAIQSKPIQPVPQVLDAFGRQTQHIPATGANKGKPLTLQWNSANQLTAVIDSATQHPIANYRYDSTGNRIVKIIYSDNAPPQATYYAYDNSHRLIAESRGGNKITRQYLYLDHRLHSLIEGNTTYAVSTDWRGLSQQVTDKNQQIVWQREMDAWGNLIYKKILTQPQRIADLNVRLAGQYYDAETGLHYNIHRYFNPQTHQYISPDPLGTPNGNNRYAYLNGNPNAGIDPLGLFKVPTGAFFGFDKYFEDRDVSAPDTGHGDILRAAFAQYNRENGFRFSNEIVRQIIVNNYHSDANGEGCFAGFSVEGGGQCNTLNHFDNPNDGAVYQAKYLGGLPTRGGKFESYTDGENDNWIADSMNQINENRKDYNYVDGDDLWISQIFNAFGQNSHALADFYAHTNWVDAQDRGGYFEELVSLQPSQSGAIRKYKCGFVPIGLNRTELWDETSDFDELYSGTIATKKEDGLSTILCTSFNPVTNAAGDVECSDDMTTHGYWAKDKVSELGGSQTYLLEETEEFNSQGKFFWQVQKYDPKKPPTKIDSVTGNEVLAIYGKDWYGDNDKEQATLVKGDRIYVALDITNRYQMAYYLAVEATKKEIERLYQATQGVKVGPYDLHEVFKQDEAWLNSYGIKYTDLYKKTQ